MLIVEDIIDSGLTLHYLMRNLRARNPASLEVCALLTKPERLRVDLSPRYVGFEIPNRFAIGYGLDHAQRYRNLDYVAALARLSRENRPGTLISPLRRFFKSAAFPILLVVILAFIAQRVITNDSGPRSAFLQRAGPAQDGPDRDGQDRRSLDQHQGQHARRQGDERRKLLHRLPAQHRAEPDQPAQRTRNDEDDRPRHRQLRPALAAHLHPPLRPLPRLLDLPDEPDAGRRLAGDELRQIESEADVRGRAEDHLPRRRRRRRGGAGAGGDQGIPREPEEVPGARRPDPQGRPALRASRHR